MEEEKTLEKLEEEETCSYCLTPISSWDDMLTDSNGNLYCTLECAMDDHGIVPL